MSHEWHNFCFQVKEASQRLPASCCSLRSRCGLRVCDAAHTRAVWTVTAPRDEEIYGHGCAWSLARFRKKTRRWHGSYAVGRDAGESAPRHGCRLYDAYLVRHSLRAHSAGRLLCRVALAVQRGATKQEGL
jgi:hypothetical protein